MDNDYDKKTSKYEVSLWKNYLVYQTNAPSLVIRDMDCYCKNNPTMCPFEGYEQKGSSTSVFDRITQRLRGVFSILMK